MVNILILVLSFTLSSVSGHLEVLHEWKYIDYAWKNPSQKQAAIDSGSYNASQIFTIDVDRDRDGRIFVTTPRQQGVPATLSIVSPNKRAESGPLLEPYPNWYWNQRTDCRGIISVYRVTIDDCNRLWVLDTGIDGVTKVCDAQLVVFDLSSDKLIKRIRIPSNFAANAEGKSLLITPVVETSRENCEETLVYMADVDGYGLVVWDGHRLRRFNDPTFGADPNHSNFTILGESFELNDGLFSLALQPKQSHSHSTRLFYRPLASLKQDFVSTRYFQRLSSNTSPVYKTLDYNFPTQVTVQAFSQGGILFMGYVNPPAIACWNSYKPMTDENVVIVAQNETTLQFTSGLKIRGKRLLVFTNRFQKLMTGTQNFSEVNFRILVERNVNNLVENTTCHP